METEIDVHVQELPGIGRRYEVFGAHGGRISVIIHHTGRRDVYVHDEDEDDEVDSHDFVQLSDAQARTLGAILGGAFFKPAVVEEIEAVIGNLLIEWVTVDKTSPVIGKTIGELDVRPRTGMTIAAIVRGRESFTAPGPDEVLRADDRLVVVGRRADFAGFRDLVGGDDRGA